MVGHVQLLDDNVSRYRNESFRKACKVGQALEVFKEYGSAPPLFVAGQLPWDHDDLVVLQETVPADVVGDDRLRDLGAPSSILPRVITREKAHDPTKFLVPDICTRPFFQSYAGHIVRAGTFHATALVDFLRSARAIGASPPPGLGASEGSANGLPQILTRVPGQTMHLATEISTASSGLSANKTLSVDPISRTENSRGKPVSHVIRNGTTLKDKKSLTEVNLTEAAMELYENKRGPNHRPWDRKWTEQLERAVSVIEGLKATEIEDDSTIGRSLTHDPADLIDPEGREFRKRIEKTPEWNRPKLATSTKVGNGSSLYLYTCMVEALKAIGKEEDWTEVRK